MKFFQKRGVAIAVLILAILASGAWGLHKAPAVSMPEGGEKLDSSLSTAAFTQYVRDEAGILSDKTEEAGAAASAADAERIRTENRVICIADDPVLSCRTRRCGGCARHSVLPLARREVSRMI